MIDYFLPFIFDALLLSFYFAISFIYCIFYFYLILYFFIFLFLFLNVVNCYYIYYVMFIIICCFALCFYCLLLAFHCFIHCLLHAEQRNSKRSAGAYAVSWHCDTGWHHVGVMTWVKLAWVSWHIVRIWIVFGAFCSLIVLFWRVMTGKSTLWCQHTTRDFVHDGVMTWIVATWLEEAMH